MNDRFAGARALADAAQIKLEIWDNRLEHGVVGDVVLVAAEHPAGTDRATAALRHHADAGGTVVLLSDPHTTTDHLIRRVVPARVGAEVLAPTDNPIVGQRTVPGLGITRGLVHDLHLEGVCEVNGGEPIVLVARSAVGARFKMGDGEVIVIGDADLFTDAQIGRAQNAHFLLGLLHATDTTVDVPKVLGSVRVAFDPERWSNVCIVDLAGRAHKIERAARRLAADHPDLTQELAIIDAKAEVPAVGPKGLKAIAGFRADGPRPAALLFRNLPFEEPGPTPRASGRPRSGYNVALALLLSCANGEIVGYRQESGGSLIQEILPTPRDALRQTSLSSGIELLMHIETAFHLHRPEAVALHCLRADPHGEAQTLIASVPRAMAELSLTDITVLSEPRYRTSVDESFAGRRDREDHRLSRRLAAIAGNIYDPFITFDHDLLRPTDPEAARALEHLNEAVLAQRVGIAMEVGDVLIAGNRHAVHGRTPFRARFDGTDRWLYRTMLIGQLPSTEFRNGRIIETRFL